MNPLRAIIYASHLAGERTDARPAMLRELVFRPALAWLLDALREAGVTEVFVVCPEAYSEEAAKLSPKGVKLEIFTAGDLPGRLAAFAEEVEGAVLLFSRPVLISAQGVLALAQAHAESGDGFSALLRADEAAGVYCFNPGDASALVPFLDEHLDFAGKLAEIEGVGFEPEQEICLPLTDCAAYNSAQKALRTSIIEKNMKNGVVFLDPDSALISSEVELGSGTMVYPGVIIKGVSGCGVDCVLGPNTMITDSKLGDRCTVNSSQLNGAFAGNDVNIGPYAYLRPGSVLRNHVKIGDFTEIKNSVIGWGTKVPHLSYIGDAEVGENTNIGCGAITCNYDGQKKHLTRIGSRVFIGSNTNLVAPVTVGDGAYTASGSTITEDVPSGALAIARSRQTNKEGWNRP